MLITNNTNVDYWFGPMHLPAGVGQTLTLDDTTETSIYLLNDAVADAVNALYASGLIAVGSPALPFPRATGVPSVLHGDGAPEGLVYAPQSSLYMRRDSTSSATSLYVKTTGVLSSTGWTAMNVTPQVVVATTVSGLGTPSNGLQGLLRAGSAPYMEIHLTYDATKGNWVSPEFDVVAQGGSTFGVSAFVGNAVQLYGVIDGYGDARTAGLGLELRAGFWMGSNQSNASSGWAFGIKSQTVIATFDTNFADYTSLASGGTFSAAVVGYDTGWVSAAGPANAARAVAVLTLTASNTGQTSNLYYPTIRARWIG